MTQVIVNWSLWRWNPFCVCLWCSSTVCNYLHAEAVVRKRQNRGLRFPWGMKWHGSLEWCGWLRHYGNWSGVRCIHVVFPHSHGDFGQTSDFTDVKMTLRIKLSVCLSSKAIYLRYQVKRVVFHIVMLSCYDFLFIWAIPVVSPCQFIFCTLNICVKDALWN